MSGEWFALWLPAFLSTLLCEVPVYALFLRDRLGLANALVLGVALQCITHPLFWLTWEAEAAWSFANYDDAVLLFEGIIYSVEALIVWALLRPREPWQRWPNVVLAFAASIIANSVSLVVGMLTER